MYLTIRVVKKIEFFWESLYSSQPEDPTIENIKMLFQSALQRHILDGLF